MRHPHAHIDQRQAENFCLAINWATAIGRPLNRFVTINFAHTDCPPDLVSAAFERLRDNHFSPWLYYLSIHRPNLGHPTHVWVIESARGMAHALPASNHMVHVHWLLHLPLGLDTEFVIRLPNWLATVVPGPHFDPVNAIDVKNVYDLPRLQRYMLKGLDPRCAPVFGVKARSQGIIVGKRCGVSRSLGPAARLLHGHQRPNV